MDYPWSIHSYRQTSFCCDGCGLQIWEGASKHYWMRAGDPHYYCDSCKENIDKPSTVDPVEKRRRRNRKAKQRARMRRIAAHRPIDPLDAF